MQLNSHSTALNLFLINQFEKEEALRRRYQVNTIVGKPHSPHDFDGGSKGWYYKSLIKGVIVNGDLPKVEAPPKWANTSINRNVKEFLKHNDLPDSGNVLNDHSLFENAPILFEGWIMPDKKYYKRLNPRREAPSDNMIHFSKFRCILDSVGYDKNSPVCMDRQGCILDGALRMYIMAGLYEAGVMSNIYIRQYDFE